MGALENIYFDEAIGKHNEQQEELGKCNEIGGAFDYTNNSCQIEKLPNLPKITNSGVDIDVFGKMGNGVILGNKIYTAKHILTYKSNYSGETGYVVEGDGSILINGKKYPIKKIKHINGKDLSIITLKGNYIDSSANSNYSNNFNGNSFEIQSRFGNRDLGPTLGKTNINIFNGDSSYNVYEFDQGNNHAIEGDSGSKVINKKTGKVVGILCAIASKNGIPKVYVQPI